MRAQRRFVVSRGGSYGRVKRYLMTWNLEKRESEWSDTVDGAYLFERDQLDEAYAVAKAIRERWPGREMGTRVEIIR